jgi:hypothetical protein
MQRSLTYSTKTIVANAGAAAGTTLVTGSSVNLGLFPAFAAVRAIAVLGTLTATQVSQLTLQTSTDNATWFDLAGSGSGSNGSGSGFAADADTGKILISEAFRPPPGFFRAVLKRGTANAVLTCMLYELFLANREPVTQDATVSQYGVIVEPLAGTA